MKSLQFQIDSGKWLVQKVGLLNIEVMTSMGNGNSATGENTDNVEFTFSAPIEVANAELIPRSEKLVKSNKEGERVTNINRQKKVKSLGKKMNKRERMAIKRAIEDLQRFRQTEQKSTVHDTVPDNVLSAQNTTQDGQKELKMELTYGGKCKKRVSSMEFCLITTYRFTYICE